MTAQLGEVIRRRVRRYREQAGLTQQQVADRTEKLGHRIGRGTLAKIERGGDAGTRADNVSLLDVLALAQVLDVPPVLLFLPLGEEEEIEIIPGNVLHPHLAYEWVAGDETFTKDGRSFAWDLRQWQRNAQPVQLFRKLRELQDIAGRSEATDEDRRRLADHLEYMRTAGLSVPSGLDERAQVEEGRDGER